jgi:hypothetical protein
MWGKLFGHGGEERLLHGLAGVDWALAETLRYQRGRMSER